MAQRKCHRLPADIAGCSSVAAAVAVVAVVAVVVVAAAVAVVAAAAVVAGGGCKSVQLQVSGCSSGCIPGTDCSCRSNSGCSC